jgi:nitrate reductase / nitrite oxidoreductase, alpha subunit
MGHGGRDGSRGEGRPDGLDAVLPAVFKESSLEVALEAEAAGATDAKAVAAHVAGRLKSKDLELAVGDPDDPENWLRIWLIWRGNAIMASAKSHEFFLRHYLGTHDNSVAEENAKDKVKRG